MGEIGHFIFRQIGGLPSSSGDCQLQREVVSPPELKKNPTCFRQFCGWGWLSVYRNGTCWKAFRGPDDKHVLRWRWKWLHDRGGCGMGLKCRGRKGEGRPCTGDSGREQPDRWIWGRLWRAFHTNLWSLNFVFLAVGTHREFLSRGVTGWRQYFRGPSLVAQQQWFGTQDTPAKCCPSYRTRR